MQSTQTRSPRARLGRRTRKAVLAAHVISAGSWIGIDVLVAVLVGVGWFGDDPETRGLAYQALAEFVVLPMLVSGLVCLATGLLLGWGTQWGLVRYWWVAVKLALNLVLCILIVVALEPGMPEVGAYGRELASGGTPTGEVSDLFFPPAVSLTALSFAVLISVLKPWGRIRR